MFITDDKLPDDVVRRRYAETKHALCCLNCGFECGVDPTQPGSIGKPLWVLLEHECRSVESCMCGRYYSLFDRQPVAEHFHVRRTADKRRDHCAKLQRRAR